ncbi:unnamed protein product [Linum tenue]|uniref:Pentatricopeptide repeat-containing protein n=1 Tax=Linum tenue TaxID=586396 RepID=A0AAV0M8S0_9ROSI|nr:unnamed protein product [Linum tenue]
MWLSPGKLISSSTFLKQVRPRRCYAAPALFRRSPTGSEPVLEEPATVDAHQQTDDLGSSVELDCSRVRHRLHVMRKEPFLALSFFHQLKRGGFVHDVYTYAAMIRILCFWNLDRKLNSMLSELVNNERERDFAVSGLLEALSDGCDVDCAKVVSKVSDVLVKLHAVVAMFDEAIDVLFCVNQLGFKPSILTCNYLMNRLIESGEVDAAVAIYMQLDCFGLHPNEYTCSIAVKAFCRKGCLDQALSVFQTMEDLGMAPNAFAYSTYIEGLCTHNSPDSGYKALQLLVEAKLPVDEFAYAVVIRGFCKQMKLKEAVDVLVEMKRQGFAPNVYAYGAIICGLCRDGNVLDAVSLHDDMLSEGVKTNCMIVTSILQGWSQAGKGSNLLSFFETCKRMGIYLDKVCYNIVMNACCKLGNMDAAIELLAEMKDKHLVPDIVNYTTVIGGYLDEGKPYEALNIFKGMKENGVIPDIVTYNVIASGFSRLGLTQEVNNLLQYMEDHDIKPNNDTYSVIIEGLCTGGNLEDAEALFSYLKDQNLDIVNAMVNGYCSARNLEKAFELFISLTEKGYTLKKRSCLKLLSSMEHDVEKSIQLVQTVLALGAEYSNIMCSKAIGMLSRAGEMEKAQYVFDLLVSRGLSADMMTYTMMINGYCRVNCEREACTLLYDMKNKGLEPDIITYTVLLDGALKIRSRKKAMGISSNNAEHSILLNELKGMDITPDAVTYTVLIDDRCKTNKFKDAVTLFQEMIDRGLQPDTVTYTALLCGYFHVGDVAGATALRDKMFDNQLRPDDIFKSAWNHGILKDLKWEAIAVDRLPVMILILQINARLQGFSLAQELAPSLMREVSKVDKLEDLCRRATHCNLVVMKELQFNEEKPFDPYGQVPRSRNQMALTNGYLAMVVAAHLYSNMLYDLKRVGYKYCFAPASVGILLCSESTISNDVIIVLQSQINKGLIASGPKTITSSSSNPLPGTVALASWETANSGV